MYKILSFLFIILPCISFSQQNKVDAFQQKAMLLRSFMDKNHYCPPKWNDTTASILYNKWVNELDKEKLFFTQSDINLLNKYKGKLADEMNGKGWDFFSVSSKIYRNRVQMVDSILTSYLSHSIDVSKLDNLTWPSTSYASDLKELTTRWQRYLKWKLLDAITENLISKEQKLTDVLPTDFAKLEADTRQKIKNREANYIKLILSTPREFEVDRQEEYLNAIAYCYDPHSNYFSTKEKEAFEADVSAMEFSAGFTFNEDDKGNKTINYLQPGGSAWRSGQLHKGDILVKIKLKSMERDATEITSDELENLLQTNGNNDVEITVRTIAGEQKKVKLIQEKIVSDEAIVKSYIIKTNKNIGYINLPGFYSKEEQGQKQMKYDGCANDVSKEIIKLRKNNIEGLIFDLRDNGGGSMWEAMQLAGIFIDIGPVASVKDRYGKVSFLKDPNRGTIYDGPLIVLTNGQSASASEFLSATLQDYNRALIVGGNTYGKGTSQIVVPLDTNKLDDNKKYEDFVKVTEAKFYRVNGSTVQWQGVVPDVMLPDLYEDISFKEKGNSSALKPDMSKAGVYHKEAELPIALLKEKSELRVKDNLFFKSKITLAKWISNHKSGFSIPLQWATYTQFYNKRKQDFELLYREKKDSLQILKVENNIFDKEKFALSTKQINEINAVNINNIAYDYEIAEACKIFDDWLKK